MINLDQAIRYAMETSRVEGNYFPRLTGMLAIAAYPSVADVELEFSKHIEDEDARLVAQAHIDMVLNEEVTPVEGIADSILDTAKGVHNLSYLYTNTELRDEIVKRCSKLVTSDIETLERTVLPEIKTYQEAIENSIVANINDFEDTVIKVRELPSILKSNTLTVEELSTYSVEPYNSEDTPLCLNLDIEQYDKLIIDANLSELIGALAVHNGVSKSEFIENLRTYSTITYTNFTKVLPSNIYDNVNIMLALYSIAQAALIYTIDGEVNTSSSDFKRSARSLRSKAASQILVQVSRLQSKETLVLHYDNVNDVATVDKDKYNELIGLLDSPKDVDAVISGFIATSDSMSIRAFSTVARLAKDQDKYLNEYKQQIVTKRLYGRDKAANKVRSDLRVLFSVSSLTDDVAIECGYNKETAKQQVDVIINNATPSDLLDTNNPIIVEIMDKVKYPNLSVASYINALTVVDKEYNLPRDEIVVMAVIKMVTASILNSFE